MRPRGIGLFQLSRRFALAALLTLASQFTAFGQTTAVDFFNRGYAKQAKGDLDGAIADYTHALELDPKHASVYNNRGNAKRAKGDLDGAIADYARALELDPKYVFAYNNRGIARQAKGDLDGAIADFSRAVELDPKYVFAYNNRGNAKRAKGDLDGAIADYTHALELDPKFVFAYNGRGRTYFIQRRWTDSLADFRRSCELSAKDQDYSRIDIWMIRTRLNERDAANDELAAYFAKRTSGMPGDWPTKIANFLLGKLSEKDFLAAAASRIADTESGQRCEAWFYIGMNHLFTGDRTAARDSFNKCVATGRKADTEYQFAEAELKSLTD